MAILSAGRVTLAVDHGEAYEALISLLMLQGDMKPTAYHEGSRMQEMSEALPESLRRTIPTVDAGQGFNWGDLVGLVRSVPAPRGVPQLVEFLSGMDPLELKLAMLGYHVPEYRRTVGEELFREAALCNPKAIRRFRLRAGRAERGALGPLLSLPADLAAERTVAILESLPAEFYRLGRDAARLLAASAAATTALARRLEPQAVIERVTRGIVYAPEPEYPEVLLIPTIVHRPWSLIAEHEAAKVICYPVFPEQARAGVPDAELVGLYRALGDETRLRILKFLTNGPATFGQLSRELGLAKSTLHQHALVLRQAGLIRQHLTGSTGLELAKRLPELDRLLRQFLARS